MAAMDVNQDTTCLECDHFRVDMRDKHLHDWDMDCRKQWWVFIAGTDVGEVRKKLKMAANCDDFVRISD